MKIGDMWTEWPSSSHIVESLDESSPILKRALEWQIYGEKGNSSMTIWGVMLNVDIDTPSYGTLHSYSFGRIPYDPSDFRRCVLLLELIPEWEALLFKVSALFPKWQPLVDNWQELKALYHEEKNQKSAPKLYQRMKELH